MFAGILELLRGDAPSLPGAGRSGIYIDANGTLHCLDDASINLPINYDGYATTVTAAGNTILTAASAYYQYFTGTTTQTVTLPVTSTLNTGRAFRIVNLSTGAITVNSSGGNLVIAVAPGTQALVVCILASGTTAASWSAPRGMTGIIDASSAGAGAIGEYKYGVVTTAANFPASGQYGDVTFGGGDFNGASSFTLTPGEWDITMGFNATANGATVTNAAFGIGTASGTSNAGLTYGDTALPVEPPTASGDKGNCIANIRKNISANTTYYAKVYASYTVATPKYTCRVSCRRVR